MRKKINIFWKIFSNTIFFFSKRWKSLVILLCIFLIADFYWTTGLVEKKEIVITVNSSFIKNADLNIICTINNTLSEFDSDGESMLLKYFQSPNKISDWIELEYFGTIPNMANIPDTIDCGNYYIFKYRHYDHFIHYKDSAFFVNEYDKKSYMAPIICINLISEDLKRDYMLNPYYPKTDSLFVFDEYNKINNSTYAFINKKSQHNMLVKRTRKESEIKYFSKPINEGQKDSTIYINLAYEGDFFQKRFKRLTKYIYTYIKVNFDNVPEKYYRDTHQKFYYNDTIYNFSHLRNMRFIIKHQNLPLPNLNISPEPDLINSTYIEYNSYEKCKQILNSGVMIYAENLHYKSFIDNLDFILATLLGALISILIDILIRKTYKM